MTSLDLKYSDSVLKTMCINLTVHSKADALEASIKNNYSQTKGDQTWLSAQRVNLLQVIIA